MTPEEHNQIWELLTQAMASTNPKQYLIENAGSLLDAALNIFNHLSSTENDQEERPSPDPPSKEIGDFKIVQKIGAGGMGTVYLAQQRKPSRMVALKLLHHSCDENAQARFRAEAEALAKLHHPGIGNIFEIGVENGIPFLVLEYCPGPSLSFYIDKELDLKIRLFLQLVDAIAHAHTQGIIHRDLKPSNVIVEIINGEPTIKVIDFGVSKLIEQDPATKITKQNVLLGTLIYMAPEQVRGIVDTRTDIHALGVLLYQLLTGKLPYGEDTTDPLLFMNKIATGGPPPPAFLENSIPADLNAITLKALATKPEERYQTAQALSDDIRAYLDSRPIAARKISRLYLCQKWLARNLVFFSAAVLVFLSLCTALGISLHQTAVAREAEKDARRRLKNQETILAFFVETFGAASPFKDGKDMSVIQAMNQAGGLINTRFADEPEIMADIHTALADTYHERGALDRALHHASEAKRIAPTQHHAIQADLVTARAMLDKSQHAEAEALCLAVLQQAKPATPEYLQAQLYRALAIRNQARYDKAAAIFAAIIPQYKSLLGSAYHQTLTAIRGLAITRMGQAQYDEALLLYQEVLKIQQAEFGNEHPRTLETLNSLANLYRRTGDHESAISTLRSVLAIREIVLGEGNPSTLRTRINLVPALRRAGQYNEARRIGEDTVNLHQQHLGPEAQETIKAQNNLALVYEALGETEQAAQLYQETYDTQARVYGEKDKLTLSYGHNLGSFYITLGRYREAESLLNKTWKARKAVYGPEHIRSLFTCFTLGECYVAMQRYDDALPLLVEAHAGVLKIHKPTHEYVVIFSGFLGYVRCKLDIDAALLEFALEHAGEIDPKYKKKLERFTEECDRAEP